MHTYIYLQAKYTAKLIWMLRINSDTFYSCSLLITKSKQWLIEYALATTRYLKCFIFLISKRGGAKHRLSPIWKTTIPLEMHTVLR